MKNRSLYYILIFFSFLIISCKQVQKVADVVIQPTAREVYERNFKKDDSLLVRWQNAFERAKNDSLQITLPYSESGVFSAENFLVYSYNLQLKEGEILVVEIEKNPDTANVFIDLLQQQNDSQQTFQIVKSSEKKSASLSFEIDQSDVYKIIVQPEMKREIPFVLKIYSQPLYTFPVSGATNKNIQSFWADPRDAGRRSHEGVDIFAARGTPVVAVTDGIIGFTGERGLGGKQVWLRDGLFGKSVYYAHLDSIAINTAQRVKLGDTVGFVGNTGNAKTTAPHLHFGIYRNTGAVNPYPYIKKTEIQQIKDTIKNTSAIVSKNRAELRKGPATVFEQFASLKKSDTVLILGKNRQWLHIQVRDSLKGYMHQSLLRELTSN